MHRRLNAYVVVFAICLFGLATRNVASQDASDSGLRAGAVVVDITPQTYPVESAGSMTPRSVRHAHDPLHARCLVLNDGKTRIALVTCDSCMIPREVFDAAKQKASVATGIAADHILCSATHTHSAVSATPVFQSPAQDDYLPFLIDRIAEGIVSADSQAAPAEIGWAIGSNPRQVFNRRWYLRSRIKIDDPFERGTDRVQMNPPRNHPSLLQPAGPIDPEVVVLSVRSLDGRPIATWANYSLHYVGGVPGDMLSADYFGEFASQFESMIGAEPSDPPFVAAMTNGTSGDINNINFFEGSDRQEPFEQIRIVANDVARSAVVAYKRIEYDDSATLDMSESVIELAVRKPDNEELARANRLIEQAGPGPWNDRRLIYAGETLDMANYPDTVKVKLQAIRIGGLAIVTTPCETFVETGLAIKKLSPFKPTFTIELANGYNGYLPTAEHHALGGYETWRAKSSYLAADAEEKIRSELLRMLERLEQSASR
ncbi:hypothetical protein [Neorhodopirellula pilleata]|uniref:Neutral/alkaline non-lysosomal ceramidase n=1 Tax=Neorhodopirellula pilleata TaxID=2714738 RepID=A0A5C6A4K1_9BACT|nr:hypothetical protein [Neorhodopirellula pilleata]TWT94366.1 Neutral/alkaline non-lysosomal ceramidase [Neorhodopirellula pilleata]